MKYYKFDKLARTFMPEIIAPGTGLTPPSNRSVLPTNNVVTIQDILDGRRYVLPGGGGEWSNGEEASTPSYKEPGDLYKRKEMDMEHFRKITNPSKDGTSEKWKVKVPGGTKEFPSFALVQQFRQKMHEKGIPVKWVARVAQKVQDRSQTVSGSLKRTFKVESIDTFHSTKETGGGFCIAPNYFLTCAHVIMSFNRDIDENLDYADYAGRFNVFLMQGGRKIPAEVVAINTSWDIAILKADLDIEPFLLDIGSMQIGDDILTIGSPHGFENNVSFGNVSSVGRRIYGHQNAPRYFFVDAPVFEGNSGGPIVKVSTGEVIGMLTSIVAKNGEYGLNVGLPSIYLRNFCIMNNIKTQ